MMNKRQFEQLVVEGFALIPEEFREKVKNVALLVEDEPSDEVRREQELADDETLLGLYTGVPLAERGDLYGVGPVLPDTIVLYQKPIEEEAGEDPEAIRKVVCDTVWHEIAHHFGFDEDEVRWREDGRAG